MQKPPPPPSAANPLAGQAAVAKRAYAEHKANLGEITMNYAVTGSPTKPALLLIPGQTESWWGFEKAMALLEPDFQIYAVDLRGQGGSNWTPERYTLDNMGNDLVRFINLVIKRPVVVSGNSSGGLLACWLAAYAMPGQIRAAHLEDPPVFAAEVNPLYGQSIRQAVGPMFDLYKTYLGDQWSVGDWQGLLAAARKSSAPILKVFPLPPEPSASLKTYDPEWGRAFSEGTVAKSCPHHRMLASVKTPILFTHHMRRIDPTTGSLMGAVSDLQAGKARELVTAAGQPFEYVDLPDAAHPMHAFDPPRFAKVLSTWAKALPA